MNGRDEWARRKRWERDVLRDGLRHGHWRVDPSEAWLPGAAVLDEAKALLRDGGRDGSVSGLRGDRLAGVVVLPPSGKHADEAGRQDAAAVLLPTDARLKGSPRRLGHVAEAFGGPVLALQAPGDEAEIAILAALGATAAVAVPLPGIDVGLLAARCRDYALGLVVLVRDRAERDAAVAAGATLAIWDLGEDDAGAALERSCRLLAGVPAALEGLGAGATTLRRALALRRAGADGALIPARLLDLEVADLDPPEPEPVIEQDPVLAQALLELGADPTAFTASASGLIVLGAPSAPEPEPEAPEPTGPLDLLSVQRPRGLRL